MRRFKALLGKELRHHAVAAIALLVCLGGAYLLMLLGSLLNPDSVTLFEAHAAFLVFVILGGIVLGNRLVVAEYYGRHQLFVEALPVRRWEMVALKYALGLAVLLLAAGFSLLATCLAALSRESVDAHFVGIVAIRTAACVFFFWSFFFAMGLVGRFRVPIYIGIFLALALLDAMTAFEIVRFSPVAVFDNTTLPYEREVLPTRAVLETLALGGAWTAVAFLLALVNEGSVAEALARRMSQREKALVGILFTALMLAVAFFEDRRDKEPYGFPEDEVVRSADTPLEILYLVPERRLDAEALLDRLEGDLGALRQELGWPALPDVRVAYGPALDAGIYEQAELEENDGILLRANFRSAEGWDPRDFSAYVVGLVLDEATRGRARFEPKAWLRDSFASWWSVRGPEAGGALGREGLETACNEGFSPLLRALWTTRRAPLDEDRLGAWLRYRERHGEDLAEAVAFTGLLVLEALHGREAVLELARRVFGREPPDDFRELFYEWRHPMAAVFEEATSLSWADFVAGWNAELDRLRAWPSCRSALTAVPEGTGALDVVRGEGTVRDLVYRFRFVEPVPPGTLATLLHERLTPFDRELERQELRRVENLWPEGELEAVWRLPGFYGQGSRAFFALEIHSAALGCPVRLLAERREIP